MIAVFQSSYNIKREVDFAGSIDCNLFHRKDLRKRLGTPLDVDCLHRAHFVAAIAADAVFVLNLRLAVLNLDGVRWTTFGAFSTSDAFLCVDNRFWRKQMTRGPADSRL